MDYGIGWTENLGNNKKTKTKTLATCMEKNSFSDEKEITSRTPPFEYFKTRRKAFVR